MMLCCAGNGVRPAVMGSVIQIWQRWLGVWSTVATMVTTTTLRGDRLVGDGMAMACSCDGIIVMVAVALSFFNIGYEVCACEMVFGDIWLSMFHGSSVLIHIDLIVWRYPCQRYAHERLPPVTNSKFIFPCP